MGHEGRVLTTTIVVALFVIFSLAALGIWMSMTGIGNTPIVFN